MEVLNATLTITLRIFVNRTIFFNCVSKYMNVGDRHLGIRLSGNPPSQKALLFYKGVGSILGIFKYTCVCEFRLEFLS